MKTLKSSLLIAVITLGGCSNFTSGELADAGTTALGVANGAAEANPLLAGTGVMAPVVSLLAKQGAKELIIAQGYNREEVNRVSDSLSWLAACHNVVVLTGGLHPAGLFAGAICGLISYNNNNGDNNE